MATQTVRHEVVIDRQLADLHSRRYTLLKTLQTRFDSIHYQVHDRKITRRGWYLTDEEARAQVQTLADDETSPTYVRNQAASKLQAAADVEASITEVQTAMEPLNAEYRQAPWSRFFLVTDGHIHSSTSCHTLRPTTEIGWLPELSGLTEKDAVEAHGPNLCTHCFPSAPVEWTVGTPADTSNDCPGSKTSDYDRKTARTGYVSGNAGTCTHCGQRVTLTSTWRMRTHRKAA